MTIDRRALYIKGENPHPTTWSVLFEDGTKPPPISRLEIDARPGNMASLVVHVLPFGRSSSAPTKGHLGGVDVALLPDWRVDANTLTAMATDGGYELITVEAADAARDRIAHLEAQLEATQGEVRRKTTALETSRAGEYAAKQTLSVMSAQHRIEKDRLDRSLHASECDRIKAEDESTRLDGLLKEQSATEGKLRTTLSEFRENNIRLLREKDGLISRDLDVTALRKQVRDLEQLTGKQAKKIKRYIRRLQEKGQALVEAREAAQPTGPKSVGEIVVNLRAETAWLKENYVERSLVKRMLASLYADEAKVINKMRSAYEASIAELVAQRDAGKQRLAEAELAIESRDQYQLENACLRRRLIGLPPLAETTRRPAPTADADPTVLHIYASDETYRAIAKTPTPENELHVSRRFNLTGRRFKSIVAHVGGYIPYAEARAFETRLREELPTRLFPGGKITVVL